MRPDSRLKISYRLFKQAAQSFSNDNAMMMSGSIAYSTVFSVAPLLIIAMAIAGFFFGKQASTGEIFTSIRDLVGPNGAQAIQTMVQASAKRPHAGILATIISVCVLVVGASSAFSQLQQSLNLIWKVQVKSDNQLWSLIRQRLLTFGMVLAIGFILLVSLVLTAALSAVSNLMGSVLPGGTLFWQWMNAVVSFGVVTALFAAIYKILPDAKLRWKDVGFGAAVTAVLFTAGKFLIGLYIGNGSVSSSYGAVGSLVVFLLWVYFSSSILLFGAEFTRAWTERNGLPVIPESHAEKTPDKAA